MQNPLQMQVNLFASKLEKITDVRGLIVCLVFFLFDEILYKIHVSHCFFFL